jgi:hypothetical protein
MKKLILSVAALSFASLLFAQPAAKTAADVAKFATESIDLGKVKQNVPATATFTVTNIGKEPLIIEQANPTCGCTISNYTKEPIAPGKTGVINATYNAAGVSHFDKHLTVKFAGVDEVKSITISGDVLAAEDYDKWKVENDAKVKADADQKAKDAEAAKPAKSSKTKTKTKTSTVKS